MFIPLLSMSMIIYLRRYGVRYNVVLLEISACNTVIDLMNLFMFMLALFVLLSLAKFLSLGRFLFLGRFLSIF